MKCAKEFIRDAPHTPLPAKRNPILDLGPRGGLRAAFSRGLEIHKAANTHLGIADPPSPLPPPPAAVPVATANAAAHFLYCRLQAGGSKGGTQTEL